MKQGRAPLREERGWGEAVTDKINDCAQSIESANFIAIQKLTAHEKILPLYGAAY